MSAITHELQLYDHSAERAVVAQLFDSPDVAEQLTDVLEPADFHNERHRDIYRAMRKLWDAGEPVDLIGLRDELSADDVSYILQATADTPPMFGRSHAARLRTLRRLRDRVEIAQIIVAMAHDGKTPEDIDAAVSERWSMLSAADKSSGIMYGWETMDWHAHELDRRRAEAEDGSATVFDWPWPSWNKIVMPLRAGLLGMLAAPDGVGKSTYLSMIAEHWASRGAHVVIVHLEDDHQYKLDRRLARHARLPLSVVESGRFDAEQDAKRRAGEKRLTQFAERLHYLHAPGMTMGQIIRELESMRAQGICDAVVLDYIDKVQADRRQVKLYGDNKWERQADDVERFKSFLEKARIPGYTATQGNKAMQGPGTQTRQNIQGSGQKSQKSQLVMILTREIVPPEGLYDQRGRRLDIEPGAYSPHADIRIDKQNRGRTGHLQQYFAGEFYDVLDLDRGQG